MKTSLIINPAAFRAELYKCFFHYRTFVINGKPFISVPSYIDSDFIVSLFDARDVDPRNYRNLPLLEAVYNYKFSANECVAMRSTSPEDYYNMFFAECSLIEKEMRRFVRNENPNELTGNEVGLSEKHDAWWTEGSHYPEDTESGCSKDVLIDMNGKRKDFQIGWYDFDERKWCFHVTDTSNLELDQMEWRYI